MKKIKVAQFGLGPIGIETLRLAAANPGLEIIGAVDRNPSLAGRALTDVTGVAALDGLIIARDLEELFREMPPELIIHTASSSAEETLLQIRPAVEFGVSVVSSCEELIFPALKCPTLVKEMDALCRHTGARVVAAGVNPGFVMDALPICLTGVCRAVSRISVERIADAAWQRRSLQAKIGCGEVPAAFAERLRLGRSGHAGLPESIALIAHVMGWPLDDISQAGEPVVATRDFETDHYRVPRGTVCGVHQRAIGTAGGVEKIVLDLRLHLGAENVGDRIVIEGTPRLDVALRGGVPDDEATVAALVNAVPRLLLAAPGLHLASDLVMPRWSENSGGAARVFRD